MMEMSQTQIELQAKIVAAQTTDIVRSYVRKAESVESYPTIRLTQDLGDNQQMIDSRNNTIVLNPNRLMASPGLLSIVVSRATAKCIYNSMVLNKETLGDGTWKNGGMPMTTLDALIYVGAAEAYSNFVSGFYRSRDRRGLGRKDRNIREMFAEFPNLEGMDLYLDSLGRYIARTGPEAGVMLGPDIETNKRILGSAIATIVYEIMGFNPVRTMNELFMEPGAVLSIIKDSPKVSTE